jgi:hypothetical protein
LPSLDNFHQSLILSGDAWDVEVEALLGHSREKEKLFEYYRYSYCAEEETTVLTTQVYHLEKRDNVTGGSARLLETGPLRVSIAVHPLLDHRNLLCRSFSG